MEFKNREVQFPGQKKLTKVDPVTGEAIPNEPPIYVKMEREEGDIYAEGTELNAENLNKAFSSMPIGTVFHANRTDVPAGCLRLDGTIYNKITFPDFYDMAAAGKFQTLSFSQYNDKLTASNGNCGYIGINTATQQFRVPVLKASGVIANTESSLPVNIGEYSKGALPNIEGSITFPGNGMLPSNYIITGAFKPLPFSGNRFSPSMSDSGGANFGLDASRSSSIYGSSAIVIPNHIQYPYFIVVSNSIPEASQTDWDNFVGNLANKANMNLNNLTVEAEIVSSKSMGNNGYIRYTSGLIIQWGQITTTSTACSIVFPIVFPTRVCAMSVEKNGTTSGQAFVGVGTNLKTANVTSGVSLGDFSYGQATKYGSWIAIGY